MLYDKRWDAKVEQKADLFKLESLIAWLESMPADQQYDFHKCDGTCMLGQYMQFQNVKWTPENYTQLHCAYGGGKFPNFGYIACAIPRTFGAALTRARSALSARQRGCP